MNILVAEQQLGISRSNVAALCFLVYDICLTADLEITYMWRTPWAAAKPFYFITRYYSLVALIVRNSYKMTCREWVVFESTCGLVLELSVQLLLILRLFAMYLGNKTVMRLMLVLFFIQAIIMAVCIGLSVPHILGSPNCVVATVPVQLVVYCIVAIMFESFLFALTISRYRHAKLDGMTNTDLMSVLVRDGVLAFVVIFGAMLTNSVFFTIGTKTMTTAGFPWLLAILGTAGARLVLNVREASRVGTTPASLDEFEVTSDIYRAVYQCDPDDEELLELRSRNRTPHANAHQAVDPERRLLTP